LARDYKNLNPGRRRFVCAKIRRAAANAAVVNFSKKLPDEVVRYHITVNVIPAARGRSGASMPRPGKGLR
jgi:hypothetical protein